MSNSIPEKIGKYEIRRQVGRGSMGIVFQGYDPFADRQIAVKVALADSLKDKESGARYRKMFFNEAHTAGMLHHPNILEILDAGVDGEDCYIVMELIEGGNTLKSFCKPETLLPVHQVVEIVFKCAKALDYAHRKGVVHRDIKPTNILVTPELDVKIGDFSIAHLVTSDTTATMPAGFVGSPRYMSPEQVQDEAITNQTDLFSLGIVMYEMLTGHHPFVADSFSRLIHKIINEKHPLMRTYRPDLPEILEKIAHHALQKNPGKRYKMGLNMAADLSLAFDYLEKPQQEIELGERFNAVRDLDFFRDFSEAQIWEIIQACSWHQYRAGEQVVAEGDVDNSLFIIVSGEVDVRKGSNRISLLSKGDCFGEMSYLAKSERTATIVASKDLQLIKISATLIDQVSVDTQLQFSKVFLRTLVKRLSATTAQLMSQSN
jgi:serine/threonine protein kinase